MQVNITARHLDLTPSLAEYVQRKLERVERHFPAVIRAQMILSVEKERHIAEIVAHAQGHHDFRAKGESADLYAAVDLVAEKLHKHMARQKDKRVRGRRRDAKRASWGPADYAPAVLDAALTPEDDALAPPVTLVKRFTPRPLTVSEAVEEMEQKNFAFLVFLNDETVSVVYKRKDKTYGLLEPDV